MSSPSTLQRRPLFRSRSEGEIRRSFTAFRATNYSPPPQDSPPQDWSPRRPPIQELPPRVPPIWIPPPQDLPFWGPPREDQTVQLPPPHVLPTWILPPRGPSPESPLPRGSSPEDPPARRKGALATPRPHYDEQSHELAIIPSFPSSSPSTTMASPPTPLRESLSHPRAEGEIWRSSTPFNQPPPDSSPSSTPCPPSPDLSPQTVILPGTFPPSPPRPYFYHPRLPPPGPFPLRPPRPYTPPPRPPSPDWSPQTAILANPFPPSPPRPYIPLPRPPSPDWPPQTVIFTDPSPPSPPRSSFSYPRTPYPDPFPLRSPHLVSSPPATPLSIESKDRIIASLTAEVEWFRRSLRDLDPVRDEFRIFQSQTIEIQQRYEEQLREIRLAVLERQSQPLAMQRFFAVADMHANKIIIQMLQQLNENIQLIAKNMAKCMIEDFEPPAMKMSEEQISAAQRVSEYIGQTLTGYLGRKERDDVALYLPTALQAYLVYHLYWIISSWSTEKGRNDLINEIYERLQKSETQTTAGRWRSLTRTYVVPAYRSTANTLASATIAGLSDVVVAAGCLKTASAAAASGVVESNFGDRISFILSTAGNFSKIAGEIISTDFNVFVTRPAEKFDGTMMEVDEGQRIPSRTATNQKVLSSTHLGLTKRIRLESGREDTSTVVKAKVVLESLLDS